MFQSFSSLSDPSRGAGRVAALRAALADAGLDGFVVPHADEHQSEYLPPSAQRLYWLTGFSGSAGAAIVLAEKAAIFVDGRYTLQVREQVDADLFAFRHLVTEPPADWLAKNAAEGARIGYDPWLHTRREVEKLEAACRKAGAELVPVDENPIDLVWTDRPAAPVAAARLHPDTLAGTSRADKIARIADDIAGAGNDAAVLTAAESVAWLLNLRGGDIAHTPLVLANAIVPAEGKPLLFVAPEKLSNEVRYTLSADVDIEPPERFAAALSRLGASGAKVAVDPALTPFGAIRLLEEAGAQIDDKADPCQLPRAVKSDAEIAGSRAAHARDAVAVCRFLAWLDREAPGGTVDEIGAATALEGFRTETGALRDISFDTISGTGPNGAVIHYRVSDASNRTLEADSLYLVDSGAQYEDGTTDITRTVAIGTPSAEMIARFTLVLKGHIALAAVRFPQDTTGAQLDTLARVPLWHAGCDYDHGTGHGVGSYLGVHEGPQRIAKTGTTPLKPGMILSNEPGYYRAGEYGIRIENLILVTEPEAIPGGDRPMHAFETLSFAPIDRRLIDAAALSPGERQWLDAYHARVMEIAGPHLDEADRAWLDAATAPLDG